MYSFKDLMIVKPENGEDEYLKYRAMKRRRGLTGGTTGGPVGESVSEPTFEEQLDEVLDPMLRMKRKQLMRRLKPKLKIGRERAKRKTADLGKLKDRAQKRARMALFRKMAAGKSKDELSYSDRKNIEKRMEGKKAIIDRMAKKMLPQVRKDEQARKQMVGK